MPQSYDVHVYQTPSELIHLYCARIAIRIFFSAWFYQNAFYYDDFQVRSIPIEVDVFENTF